MSHPPVTIRPPRLTELPALRKLFCDAVRHHFSYFPAHYQQQIIRENSLWRLFLATLGPKRPIYVAVSSRGLQGYVIAGQAGGEGHIYWLFVRPDARGQDLGLQLLNRAFEQMARQGAKRVVLNTHDHERYYQRHGFATDSHWELHGVSVTHMSLSLGKASS